MTFWIFPQISLLIYEICNIFICYKNLFRFPLFGTLCVTVNFLAIKPYNLYFRCLPLIVRKPCSVCYNHINLPHRMLTAPVVVSDLVCKSLRLSPTLSLPKTKSSSSFVKYFKSRTWRILTNVLNKKVTKSP